MEKAVKWFYAKFAYYEYMRMSHILQGMPETGLIFVFVNLGANIRHFRRQAGMTQAELASKIGARQYAIAKYEKGIHSPTPEALAQIAKALAVEVGDLYALNGKEISVENKGSGSRRETQIQKIFRELPPAKQRAVLEHAKGLKKGK